jgi:BirA family biotin operon repressor/biotin-[acetyl-CoA-carboxylase] ligase
MRLSLQPKQLVFEIARLQRLGCEIESHPQRGIRLIRTGLASWQDYLKWSQRHAPSRIIEIYGATTSTQDVARRIVETHGPASHQAVVVTDEQTAGRGRLGRKWIAPPGTSAVFSVIHVEPVGSLANGIIDRLTLSSAVAVARAVESIAPSPSQLQTTIKWPNDVQLAGRKLAGILVETFQSPRLPGQVVAVIGVGINVSFTTEQLAPEHADLRDRLTSLSIHGCDTDRLLVIASTLSEMQKASSPLHTADTLQEWKRRCPMLGRDVTVKCNGQIIRGQIADLDPDAALILRTREDQIIVLTAATTTVL